MEDKKGITLFALGLDIVFMIITGVSFAYAPKSYRDILIVLLVVQAIVFVCFSIYFVAGIEDEK